MTNLNPGFLPGQKIVIGPDDAPAPGQRAVLGLSQHPSSEKHMESETIGIDVPGGVPLIGGNGVIPARVSVLTGTLDEIGDIVLAAGELACQLDDAGGLVGVRVGSGSAAMRICAFVGDGWEKDDSSSVVIIESPSNSIVYETASDSVVSTDQLMLTVELTLIMNFASSSTAAISVGRKNGSPIPGLEWYASRGDTVFGPYPADGAMKSVMSGIATMMFWVSGRTPVVSGANTEITIRATNGSNIAYTQRRMRKRK